MKALTLALLGTVVAVASAARPCLPDQLEFLGADTKGRSSYNALDFTIKMTGMKRDGNFTMVKDFSGSQAKRYDITPDRCDVYNVGNEPDFPQCVPDSATQVTNKHGAAWQFKNAYGATLYYSTTNPAVVFEKLSPDGTQSDNFMHPKAEITDPSIFKIPARCA